MNAYEDAFWPTLLRRICELYSGRPFGLFDVFSVSYNLFDTSRPAGAYSHEATSYEERP